jgi:uncharacterized protein YraI
MKHYSHFQIAAIFLILLTLAACGTPSGGPQVWFDRPLDNTTVPQAPLTIQAHASDEDGVAQIEFFANDAPLFAVETEGSRLGEAIVQWTPPGPGIYLISAWAIDGSGNRGSLATTRVIVSGSPTPTPDGLFLADPGTEAQPANNIPTSVQITGVECTEGLVVNVDISISHPQGIASYDVFSTWVATEPGESFSAPYPKNIDKRVQLVEPYVDDMDRSHQIGLKVMVPNDPNPLYAYAYEPNNRCPGHYQPLMVVDPSSPTAPLVNATQNANCRSGPSIDYDIISSLLEGQSAEITGRSADGGWWVIDPGIGGKTCWIAGSVVQVSGDVSGVIVIAAPPLPVTGESPTETPTPTQPPPSDTAPPIFNYTEVNPDEILTEGGGCSSYSRTTTVTASVSDESDISYVVANWNIGSESGQITLGFNGDQWVGTVGPVNTTGDLSITMTAQDIVGNTAQSGTLYVTVNNCIN